VFKGAFFTQTPR
jgi:hypothetical protein